MTTKQKAVAEEQPKEVIPEVVEMVELTVTSVVNVPRSYLSTVGDLADYFREEIEAMTKELGGSVRSVDIK
jgi:hypothetical protein